MRTFFAMSSTKAVTWIDASASGYLFVGGARGGCEFRSKCARHSQKRQLVDAPVLPAADALVHHLCRTVPIRPRKVQEGVESASRTERTRSVLLFVAQAGEAADRTRQGSTHPSMPTARKSVAGETFLRRTRLISSSNPTPPSSSRTRETHWNPTSCHSLLLSALKSPLSGLSNRHSSLS